MSTCNGDRHVATEFNDEKRVVEEQRERLTDARVRLARARGDERFVLVTKDDRFGGFDHQLTTDERGEDAGK